VQTPFSLSIASALVLLLSAVCLRAADSNIIAPGATLEKLAGGFEFTEGPAADKEGNVFFTDQPNDRIVKWSAAEGTVSDWMKPCGRSNGTYFDKDGNLIACADEKNELWSIAPDKKATVLVREAAQRPQRPLDSARRRHLFYRSALQTPLLEARSGDAAGWPACVFPRR